MLNSYIFSHLFLHLFHIRIYTERSLWMAGFMRLVCESTTFIPTLQRAAVVNITISSSLSHLVSFAMKLRNLGISDHGLIRELSSPLAGSLYSGEGHSRLYDDEALYR